MKSTKKFIRNAFREIVFERDRHECVKCGYNGEQERSPEWRARYRTNVLSAHHITDRSLMPDGGYVLENGITLCDECHLKAEMFHSTGASYPGFSPEDLYKAIGSSRELAEKKANECMEIDRNRQIRSKSR